jgi:hypothetical protein
MMRVRDYGLIFRSIRVLQSPACILLEFTMLPILFRLRGLVEFQQSRPG